MYSKLILLAVLLLPLFPLSRGYAQKHCDISILVERPVDGAVIAPGDTAFLDCRIINLGPDTITATDTLSVYFNGYYFMDISEEILPGQALVEPMLGVWQDGDAETDDTLTACLAIEPYGNVSFVDTILANNNDCSSFILKGKPKVNSIYEVKKEPALLQLHPNPATREVYITLPEKQRTEVTVAIYDISGRLVIAEAAISRQSDLEIKVDISPLSGGVYWLKMYNGNRISNGKLIVR